MLAKLGGAHRLLVGRAPGIDVCADKQEVVFGKRDLGGALGKQVTGQVALIFAVPPSDGMQRLGAGRSKLPSLEVEVLDNLQRPIEFRHRLREPDHRVIDLLVRATHLDPPLIPLARVDEIIQIEVALGQIEHRPRILGVAFDLGQQQIAVARIRLRIPTAGTEATRFGVVVALEAPNGAVRLPYGRLVDDAFIAHAYPVAEQLRAPVGEGGISEAQAVDVGA